VMTCKVTAVPAAADPLYRYADNIGAAGASKQLVEAIEEMRQGVFCSVIAPIIRDICSGEVAVRGFAGIQEEVLPPGRLRARDWIVTGDGALLIHTRGRGILAYEQATIGRSDGVLAETPNAESGATPGSVAPLPAAELDAHPAELRKAPPVATGDAMQAVYDAAEQRGASEPPISPRQHRGGKNYAAQDQPLIEEMHRLLMATPPKATSPWEATDAVAVRAVGGGTIDARRKRLLGRYSEAFSPERYGKD